MPTLGVGGSASQSAASLRCQRSGTEVHIGKWQYFTWPFIWFRHDYAESYICIGKYTLYTKYYAGAECSSGQHSIHSLVNHVLKAIVSVPGKPLHYSLMSGASLSGGLASKQEEEEEEVS